MRALAGLLAPVILMANPYSVQRTSRQGVEVVRLIDASRKMEAEIVPAIGNNSWRLTVNGVDVFWSPYQTLTDWKAKPTMLGNPFLAPWANRIDKESYWVNGKQYLLNPGLNNYRKDAYQQPIHGLVVYTDQWQVTQADADTSSAWCASRLNFSRQPAWMAQFPFAHAIDMTYRLRDGALEVETVIHNFSVETMPVSVGYHPYFKIADAPRDAWQVDLPVTRHVMLTEKLVPSGQTQPPAMGRSLKLTGTQLDDVFTGLERGPDGLAVFRVKGARQQIEVVYGPNYPVAVVYAPKGRDFICFEPMSGVTNVFNLAHEGKFPLQTIAPGGQWRESFWIRPSGY